MVALSGEEYRQHVELMRNQREVLRCLFALDIPGIRKVWKQMAPHLDQPESDWDALRTMHEARVRMLRISPQQKRYQRALVAGAGEQDADRGGGRHRDQGIQGRERAAGA